MLNVLLILCMFSSYSHGMIDVCTVFYIRNRAQLILVSYVSCIHLNLIGIYTLLPFYTWLLINLGIRATGSWDAARPRALLLASKLVGYWKLDYRVCKHSLDLELTLILKTLFLILVISRLRMGTIHWPL